MKTLDGLIQGTAEWLSARKDYYTASEAPAMLGLSKYKTRSTLVREKATGIVAEVDEATQRRFDAGHEAELKMREWAEDFISNDLYPVTGVVEVDGLRLLASFDGLVMDESICWENKLWNEDFAEMVRHNQAPDTHWPQMEQQMLVSGADKVLFTVGDGVNVEYMWYLSQPERRARLIAGWKQFEKDVKNYQHVEIAEKPAAQPTIELPALFVQAHGGITSSNMTEYGLALQSKLSEVRSIVLVTDQDFSNAKGAATMFREQIKKLAMAKEQMLSQTLTVGEAARMMDAWSEDLRVTALQLEKDVKREDEKKKIAMIDAAKSKFAEHIEALNKRIGGRWMPATQPDFALAIKGKSKYASMQESIDHMLRDGMWEADLMAKRIEDNRLEMVGELDWSFLFPDWSTVCVKPCEDFSAQLSMRIINHNAAESKRMEAMREKIAAEEKVKAEAEAQAKAKAEQAERDMATARAMAEERGKLEQERVRLQAEADAARQKREEVERVNATPGPTVYVAGPAPDEKASATTPEEKHAAANEPVITQEEKRAVVIEHQDDIAAFIHSRDLKDANYIRGVLVEYEKFKLARHKKAA